MLKAIQSVVSRKFQEPKPQFKTRTEHGSLMFHYEGDELLEVLRQPAAAEKQLAEKDILQKAREILRERAQAKPLKSPSQAKELIKFHCATLETCASGVVLLGPDFNVLDIVDLTLGTWEGCDLSPREIVKAALAANATSVFVYTNTLNKKAPFSEAEVEFANVLRASLSLVDVRLLDVFKAGSGALLSLREESAKRHAQEEKKAAARKAS